MSCEKGHGPLKVRETVATITGVLPTSEDWHGNPTQITGILDYWDRTTPTDQRRPPRATATPTEAMKAAGEMFDGLGIDMDDPEQRDAADRLIAQLENGEVTITRAQAARMTTMGWQVRKRHDEDAFRTRTAAETVEASLLSDTRPVLDPDMLAAALERGHVRIVDHADYPYQLYNYTDACTWENGWDDVTLACRGLILHKDTGEVIARPFAKFFNHGQMGAPDLDPDETLVVMDKADGSLAITFPDPDGRLLIATRGSFTSDQSQFATALYRRKYEGAWSPNPDHTYLMEIIYPENRVVLDYGDTQDLILLGAVNKGTGRSVHVHDVVAQTGWPGPTVEVLPHTTLREALNAPDRPNAEGFVLWNPETDERVKVKQEDYKRLHKFLTGTNEKNVWEVLSSGVNPSEHFAEAPDEFHAWLKNVIDDQQRQYTAHRSYAEQQYQSLVGTLNTRHGAGGWERKDFALAAKDTGNTSMMFALLDAETSGSDAKINDMVWRAIKPRGTRTARVQNSDAD